MYERMHAEGEEIPLEEIAIAVIEGEINSTYNRIDTILEKINESRKLTDELSSNERYLTEKMNVLIETVERLKEGL